MINKSYSTTHLLTKPYDDSLQYGNDGKVTNNTKFAINNAIFNIKNSKIIGKQQDTFETLLFLPEGEGRQGEGGLRTKGYFKHLYNMVDGEWWIVDSNNNPVIPAPEDIQSKIKQYLTSTDQHQTPSTYLPLITVITVVYNGAKYLEETILSVINQTYPNVEYIIIDGGSTDGTLDIIKKYEDYIDYWVSEKDKGIYDAMNKGIDLANGEWINFMNAGDRFYQEKVLETVFLKYRSAENINVIYGDVCITDFITGNPKTLRAGLIDDIYKGSQFSHQSSFINSKLHKKIKYNICYKITADFNFFYTVYNTSKDSFMYINNTISFIARNGLSDKNRIACIVSFWNIVEKNTKTNFYYLLRISVEMLKLFVKKIFFTAG
ncbi:MAG: glycosyltransferase [Elusimicrobiales bacterium]|jgi:hypothetical protein|nr:glycosyltransferase [Elusimicrobiales bacterium]